ncbi:MAG TPA: rhomboid family intramembrane serine protease [Steroidobacteraceae bacterium]|nr:rhomboid family intramembrane serine protease [Steroidobacteraceae bacterium]
MPSGPEYTGTPPGRPLFDFLNTVVGKLIAANVIVYALQRTLGPVMMQYFALWPLGDYSLTDARGSVGFEPWQIVTCAFLHDPKSITHILLNMYGLWAFGTTVERALGARRFAWLYFASILTSGIIQLIFVTATIEQGVVPTVGASGGVFGVLLAFGLLFPHARVMLIFPPIPMKAWFMVIAYAAIELFSGVTGTMQGVAHFAHLGGMLGAFLLMLSWRRRSPPAPPDVPG